MNVLPLISAPYVIVLPPPETTPLSTLSCETGTPSCCEACLSMKTRAAAAAARICGPVPDIAFEPPSPPVLTASQVSTREFSAPPASYCEGPYRISVMSWSSSSATTWRKPVVMPFPVSIFVCLRMIVLSALTASHESICVASAL